MSLEVPGSVLERKASKFHALRIEEQGVLFRQNLITPRGPKRFGWRCTNEFIAPGDVHWKHVARHTWTI